MAVEKILVVEDDKNISQLIRYNLEKAGFECRSVITGEEAFTILDTEAVSLVILDVMLPKMSGFEVCRELKHEKKYTYIPVTLLTAKGEEVDRIVGLELGADDYIVKPFSPRELVLRVKAILKRGKSKKEETKRDIIEADFLKIDIPRHKITVHNKDIQLTAMEFNLLVLLLERRGRVQSREQLLTTVWQIESDVTTRTVDTHIKRLRQKLGKMGDAIETVRGLGYRFKDEDEE